MTNILIPDKEFFSIREVSEITDVEPYTLRYWESEFKSLGPPRRVSGHRKYTKSDINLILTIKDLLYVKRFTIEGAKKYLVKEKKKKPEQLQIDLEQTPAAVELLKETKKILKEILDLLEK